MNYKTDIELINVMRGGLKKIAAKIGNDKKMKSGLVAKIMNADHELGLLADEIRNAAPEAE